MSGFAVATTPGGSAGGVLSGTYPNPSLSAAYGLIPYSAFVNIQGADPTGAVDSTTAFKNALIAAGASGTIGLGEGTYKIGATAMTTFVRNQGMVGPGSSLVTINYTGSGTAINVTDGASFGNGSNAGPFSGFTIDGTSAGAGAVGFAFGNMTAARNNDITVQNFSGATAIGFNLINTGGFYSEQGVWTGIRAVTNTNNIVLDTGSHDYNYYQFYIDANVNQNGIITKNGATCVGCTLIYTGNFHTGTSSNSGVAWIVGTSSSDAAGWDDCLFSVSCEADGVTVAHKSIQINCTSSNGILGSGTINFTAGAATFTNATVANGNFGVSPYVQVPGFGLMSNGESLSVPSASLWNIAGGPTNSPFGGNIYWGQGDIQMQQLSSGANTFTYNQLPSSSNTSGKRLFLAVVQPSSGGAGTLTWDATTVWVGGTKAALSTVNNAIDWFEILYIPQTNSCYTWPLSNSQIRALGIGAANPTVIGTVATAPPTNATIQTALGNLILGTAYQNTLSYDIRLTIYLSVTVNTSGVVKLGVGVTNTPTQATIVTGVTTIGFLPVTFKIPAGQYGLLSISGTVTDSIAGQYLEAA